jgi:hypothetical protein
MRATLDLSEFNGYTPIPGKRGWFHIYKVDACETCGGEVQAANSMNVSPQGGETILRAAGLTRRETAPVEGFYDDDSGMEACENCG